MYQSRIRNQSPLDLKKLSLAVGTQDADAFILSLRDSEDVSSKHSYGIHRVPHLGVYGLNYSLALPLVLLSLPPSLSCLKQLPSDILNVLDINLSDLVLVQIAKELIHGVLLSACSKSQPSFTEFRDETTPYIDEDEEHERELGGEYVSLMEDIPNDEEMVRLVAKKLVRKVIHSACERIDERRSSIELEYLISNTKKLKIEALSPLHTPPSSPLQTHNPLVSILKVDNSSLPLTTADSGISLSSVATTVSNLSIDLTDDQTDHLLQKLGKRRQRSESHDAVSMREGEVSEKHKPLVALPCVYSEPILEQEEGSTSPDGVVQEKGSVNGLIVDLGMMSIMEEVIKEKEDEYIILEAVTKPVSTPVESNRLSPIPLFYSDSYTVPNMDYFIMIHSYPPPAQCQKFLCNNTDEVNLLFHCWLYRDIPFDHNLSVLEYVNMGIFCPDGVAPVHLDLQDGGVAFYYLEPRSVCIHGCCFSPENAQLQLQNGVKYHTFFSVACHDNRRVVTFHIIPPDERTEHHLRDNISRCDTLRELLACFNELCFPPSKKLCELLIPFH